MTKCLTDSFIEMTPVTNTRATYLKFRDPCDTR